MAETVQYYLEQMVPEFEDLERKEIFKKEEIKSIIKKRTNFEYALKRRPAQIVDFLKYIEYEMNLDLLRKKRKSRLGIKGKVTISDYSIKRRIYHIFDRATTKFAGDIKLWLQYIEYAKNEGDGKVLSKIFGSVLQLHPTKPMFWIMTSKYEFEVNTNIMSARVFLQRGLRLNRDSHQLWHQYFKLELIYVEKIKARRKILGISNNNNNKDDEPIEEREDSQNFINITNDDDFSKTKKLELEGLDNLPETNLDDDNILLCGELAKVVYSNAIKAIPSDLSFRKEFIDICREFSDTNTIQEEIYESIQKDFENNSEALSYVAERHVANISDVQSIEFINAMKNSISEFQKCIEKFPKDEMWYMFSKMLLKYSHMVSEPNLIAFLNKKLLKTYKAASESNLASSQMYLDWIDWILEKKDSNERNIIKIKELLKKATDTWPNNSKLWERRINITVSLNINEGEESKNDSIDELYKLALKLNPTSLILWDSYLFWIFKKFKNGDLGDFELEKLLLNSISKISSLSRSVRRNNDDDDQPNEVKDQITTSYLKWAVEKGGLDNARKIYKSLFNKTLPTLKFYKTCIEIEQEYLEKESISTAPGSKSHLIWLYEQACGFEEAPSDLWLDFIQFYLNNKEVTEASNIYWKAMKNTKDPESFEAKYRQIIYQFNNKQKK